MAVAGWQCIVQITGTPAIVGDLTQADLTIMGDIYDITAMNTTQWKSKLGGLADYNIKLAGNFNMSDAQQATLQGYIITNPGTVATWQVQPKGIGATTKYNGTAIVKQEALKFAVNAKEDVSWDLEGTGPLVFTA